MRTSSKKTALEDSLELYNPKLATNILRHNFIFQQDTVDEIASSKKMRIPSSDIIDLSSTVCAGISYWSALSILGLEKRPISDFIEEIYHPQAKIKHTLGVSHVDFVKYLGKTHSDFYGLTLNPFRDQDVKKFIEYKGYTGKDTEAFFRSNYKNIKSTSTALKAILEEGGLGVVSIQGTFNNYSPNFHDVLVLGFREQNNSFLMFDPDARVHFDTQKLRPEQVSPIKKSRGFYTVTSEYLDTHTYREKPSPGGITIGLFSKQPSP